MPMIHPMLATIHMAADEAMKQGLGLIEQWMSSARSANADSGSQTHGSVMRERIHAALQEEKQA